MSTDDPNVALTQQLTQDGGGARKAIKHASVAGKKRVRAGAQQDAVDSAPFYPSVCPLLPDVSSEPSYFPSLERCPPHSHIIPNMTSDVVQSVLRRACKSLGRTLATAPIRSRGPLMPCTPTLSPCGPMPAGDGTTSNYWLASHTPCPDFTAYAGHASHTLFSQNSKHYDILRKLRAHVAAASELGNRSSHALWGSAQSGKRRIITGLGSIFREESGVHGGDGGAMLVLELDGNVLKGDDEAIRRIVEETRLFLQMPAGKRLRQMWGGLQRLGPNPSLHDLLALGEDFELGVLGDDLPSYVNGGDALDGSVGRGSAGTNQSLTPSRGGDGRDAIIISNEDVLDGFEDGDGGEEGAPRRSLFGFAEEGHDNDDSLHGQEGCDAVERDVDYEDAKRLPRTEKRVTIDDDVLAPATTSTPHSNVVEDRNEGESSSAASERFNAGPASSSIGGALSKLQACLLYFNQIGITLVVLIHNIKAFGMLCDRVMYILSGLLHETSMEGGFDITGERHAAAEGSSNRGVGSDRVGSRRVGGNASGRESSQYKQGGVSFIVSSLAPDVTLEKRLSSRLTCEMWFCPLISQPPLVILPSLFYPVGLGEPHDIVLASGRSNMKAHGKASPVTMWSQTSVIVALHAELQLLEIETVRLFEKVLEKRLKEEAATQRRQQIQLIHHAHRVKLQALAQEQAYHATLIQERKRILDERRKTTDVKLIPPPNAKKRTAAQKATEAFLKGEDLPPLPPAPPKTLPQPQLPTVERITVDRKSFEELYLMKAFDGLAVDDKALVLPLIIKMNRLRRELAVAELIGTALTYGKVRGAVDRRNLQSSPRSLMMIRVSGIDETISLGASGGNRHYHVSSSSGASAGGSVSALADTPHFSSMRSSLMSCLIQAAKAFGSPPPHFSAMTVPPSLNSRIALAEAAYENHMQRVAEADEAPPPPPVAHVPFAFSPAAAAATQALPILWGYQRLDAVRTAMRGMMTQLGNASVTTAFSGAAVASSRYAVMEVLSRGLLQVLGPFIDPIPPHMYPSPSLMEQQNSTVLLQGEVMSLQAQHQLAIQRAMEQHLMSCNVHAAHALHISRYEGVMEPSKVNQQRQYQYQLFQFNKQLQLSQHQDNGGLSISAAPPAPPQGSSLSFALPSNGITALTDLLDDGNLVRLGYACAEHIILLAFVFVRLDAGMKRSLKDLQEDIHNTMRDTNTGGIGMVGDGAGRRGGAFSSAAQRAAKDQALATAFNDLKEWGLLGEDKHRDVFIVGPIVRLHDFLRWFLNGGSATSSGPTTSASDNASLLGMDAMTRQVLANLVR